MEWERKPLESVAEKVVVGYVGPSSDYFTADGVAFLRTGNVGAGQLVLSNLKRVVLEFHLKQKKSILKEGDVLVSRVVSDQINAAVVPAELEGANCGNIIVIRPGKLLDSRFVMHLIATPSSQRQLLSRQVGSAQAVVNTAILKEWEVPAPPLCEQRRIAAILDKADALRRKCFVALKKTESLPQFYFRELFETQSALHRSWETRALGDILEFLTSGSRGWAKHYAASGSKFLRIQNVRRDRLDLSDLTYVSAPKTQEAIRTKVQPSDVLLSITADLGRSAVVPRDIGEAYINQHLSILRTKALDPVYLSSFISSQDGQKQIRERNRQAVKAGLNFEDIRSIKVPIPPVSIQQNYKEVVRHVEDLRADCNAAIEKADRLFDCLQHRAFRGQL